MNVTTIGGLKGQNRDDLVFAFWMCIKEALQNTLKNRYWNGDSVFIWLDSVVGCESMIMWINLNVLTMGLPTYNKCGWGKGGV